jgi:hypothetical protein
VGVSHVVPDSSEVLPIAMAELVPDECGICNDSEEEGEILVVAFVAFGAFGAAFVLSGAGLDEDAAGKVRAWDGAGAFPYLHLDLPASPECEGTAFDADSCRLSDGS